VKRLRSLRLLLILELLRPLSLPSSLRLLRFLSQSGGISVNLAYRRYLTHTLLLHDARNYASLLQVDGLTHLQEALARGGGAVLLSSKVGLPRLLRWYLRTCHPNVLYLLLIGFPARADQSFSARFQRWHWSRFHFDRDSLAGNEPLSAQYMTRAFRHLRANGIVNIAGDGGTGEQRVPVTIAGRQHQLASGGIALGVLSGAAIIPCFTVMEPGDKFRIEFQPPLHIPANQDRDAQLRQLTTEYAARIDQYILAHPDNTVAPRYAQEN
jgi:lauroyl/myristoyl acyltransferase